MTWSRFALARVRKPICTQHKAGTTRGDATTGSCLMEGVVCGSFMFLQFFPGLSAAVVLVSGLLVRANARDGNLHGLPAP